MLPKKNIFGYFAISVFIISAVYILAGGVMSLGSGQEYPYLQSGVFLSLLLCFWLLLNGTSGLIARLDKDCRLSKIKWLKYMEFIVVVCVLALAAAARIYIVKTVPMAVESDYKTYYEIAELITRGTLRENGPGYCDYITMFPHVYGYPYVLSIVFRFFGISVEVAQSFNIVLSVVTVFICYRIGRLIGGRLCGMVTLFLTAFWPSQIVYINMVASEYLFTCLLMLCMYLFVLSIKDFSEFTEHSVLGVVLHVLLGLFLALAGAVRPMALLLLITILICISFEKLRLPVRLSKDQPISLVFLSKGWMRCFLIVAVYMLISTLITIGITNAIDKDLASGSTSFGYNLLVGLNVESEGGWNQDDADYLYDALDRTGSASEAHMACRDLAVQRLRNVKGIANLFVYKFQVLWMNDDYGTTWNLLFLDQQGNLTETREDFLYNVRSAGNIFYLLVVVLATIEGLYLWQRGVGLAYPFLLMYLGTAAMHLLVENQNRYHFHALYMFAILAALGIKDIKESTRVRVQQKLEERRDAARRKQEDEEKKEALLKEEEHLTKLRHEAMNSQFDMKDALEKGYITVRVTQAYADELGIDEYDETPEESD